MLQTGASVTGNGSTGWRLPARAEYGVVRLESYAGYHSLWGERRMGMGHQGG